MSQRIVGFTGSREIRTSDLGKIKAVVDALPEGTKVVTGGCVGVDAWVAYFAHHRGLHVHVVLPANHTLVDPEWETTCTTFEQMGPHTSYRERDTKIVFLSQEMIAFPAWPEDNYRSRRSGTWMTVRIARSWGLPVQEYILRGHTEADDSRRPLRLVQ